MKLKLHKPLLGLVARIFSVLISIDSEIVNEATTRCGSLFCWAGILSLHHMVIACNRANDSMKTERYYTCNAGYACRLRTEDRR